MTHGNEPKTKDDVYRERNLLALAFVRFFAEVEGMHGHFEGFGWWPGADDANAEEWAVVWAWTPHGQVAWHVPAELIPEWLPKRDPKYDGYSTQQKNERLERLIDGWKEGGRREGDN